MPLCRIGSPPLYGRIADSRLSRDDWHRIQHVQQCRCPKGPEDVDEGFPVRPEVRSARGCACERKIIISCVYRRLRKVRKFCATCLSFRRMRNFLPSTCVRLSVSGPFCEAPLWAADLSINHSGTTIWNWVTGQCGLCRKAAQNHAPLPFAGQDYRP